MIKSFRVAALAAVTAFLCPAAAQAAERQPASIVADSAAPVMLAEASAPFVTADTTVIVPVLRPAISNILPIAPAPATNVALTPATASALFRARPDRAVQTNLIAIPLTTPLRGGVNAAATPVRPLADLVTQHMSSATDGNAEFDCLARTVYFESRGEPLEGQLAVAEVVLNRVRSGRFRDTVCGVVTQRAQFSFVRSGIIPEVPRESAAWQRSVAIARIAVNKLASINGEQSLFFHATYVHPNFGRERIGTIGRHIFFR